MNGIIRIILSAVVILGGGYIGILVASGLDTRVRQLEQFRLALMQMEFSIGFLKLPLADAISGAAKSRSGVVSDILVSVARDIGEENISPSAAFSRAVRKNRSLLCLKSDDIEILNDFSVGLGRGNTESELCNINAACAKLSLALEMAVSERDARAKMWRGVGLLSGCFAVVLLF